MIDVIETTDGVNALKLIIQLFLLVSAFAGSGFLLGRFIYSRTVEIKDATIQEVQLRCMRYQELIATAEDLSGLKEEAKNLRESTAHYDVIGNAYRIYQQRTKAAAEKPGNA